MGAQSMGLLVAAILAALGAVYVQQTMLTSPAAMTVSMDDTPRKRHRAPGRVRVVDWTEHEASRADDADADKAAFVAYIGEVAKRSEPLVLRQTPLRYAWRATSLWTPAYLVDKYGEPGKPMKDVWHSFNDTIWLCKNESVIQKFPGTRCWYQAQTLPLDEVVARLSQPQKYGYYYIHASVSKLGKELQADVQPTSLLTPFPMSVNWEQSQLMWLGSAGVTTQMHYDSDYNFNLQVTGQKRFMLLPPSFHNKVFIFPRMHQNHRRSQLDLSVHANDEDWALAAEIFSHPDAVEVTMNKGDMLYLPPFWLHHVTNINAGISVNVWTEPSEYKQIIADLRVKASPPLAAGVAVASQHAYFAAFLTTVLEKLGYTDPQARLQLHWDQRYERLTRQPNIRRSAMELDGCAAVQTPAILRTMAMDVVTAVAAAQRVRRVVPEAFETTFADFIDTVAYDAMQSQHELMASFLLNCVQCARLWRTANTS